MIKYCIYIIILLFISSCDRVIKVDQTNKLFCKQAIVCLDKLVDEGNQHLPQDADIFFLHSTIVSVYCRYNKIALRLEVHRIGLIDTVCLDSTAIVLANVEFDQLNQICSVIPVKADIFLMKKCQ